ncbi:hypothetical protein GCM10009678_72360 [Actinomadura kijaniata]|uniref:LysM domain-containing protein n=1 Tax=Actinomadura namibiensis TaxID=182080 RepID=A0A7W3LYK4_ACTNM|nr:LysM domain-containing protein [Actinomadura namibiensis]MBA8956580.1 hypothetical protein [Actinomadura namibiensis]
MFTQVSRYQDAPTASLMLSDGRGGQREVRYLLPGGQEHNQVAAPPTSWHRVRADDRIDLIAAHYLGDPAAYWQVCDANAALDPFDLVGPHAEGSVLAIPGGV